MLNGTTISEGSAKKGIVTPRIRRIHSETPLSLPFEPEDKPIPTKIRVALRVRPSGDKNSSIEIKKNQEKPAIFINKNEKNQLQFSFDYIFAQDAEQNLVYNDLAKNSVKQCLEGQNVCFFAYGQTGSGKTYSIMGTDEEPGLLPRFCDDLFYTIREENKDDKTLVSVSFFEIYQEKVYDLLSNDRKALRVRGGDMAYVEGVENLNVKNSRELAQLRRRGLARRATAATLVNELSSRSHAIFCLTVRQDRKETINELEKSYVSISNCYFVDLAGSERISYTNGTCINETVSINISLLSLQRVIDAHAEGSSYINYRDSLLTRLLKDCFGGNSMTTLIALISPETKYEAETVSTLRFASKAALVSQNVERNVDPFIQAIKDLKAENEHMRNELERLRKIELEKKILDWNRPEPPCIVQLMPDPSMSFWTKIEPGHPLNWSILENSQNPSMTILSEDKSIFLQVYEEQEVVLNGKFETSEKIQLFHGDRIVLAGKHFLFVYSDDMGLNNIASYEKIKLEYVEASAEALKYQLFEEAKQEFEDDENEFVAQLKDEIEQLKEEHQKLIERLEIENRDKEDFACQFSEIETNLKEAEELKKAIEETDYDKDFLADLALKDEDKELALNLKAEIIVITDILKQVGKSKQYELKLILSGKINDKSCLIRLTDNKGKLFAELNVAEFDSLREKICILYTEMIGDPKNLKNKIDLIIRKENLEWKSLEVGRRSSIVNRRLTEALNESSFRRSSNIFEKTVHFKDRPSIIDGVLSKPSEASKLSIDLETLVHFAQGLLTEPIVEYRHFLESLAFQVIEIEENLSNLISIKNMGESITEENTQIAFSIITVSTLASNLQRFLLQIKTLIDETNSINEFLPEMIDLVGSIRKSLDSYLSLLQSNDTIAEIYKENFSRFIQRLYILIGQCSITNNFSLSYESRFEQIKPFFQQGVLETVYESYNEASNLLSRYQLWQNPRACVVASILKSIMEICNHIKYNYDKQLIYGILRKLLNLKDFLMLSKNPDYALEAKHQTNEILRKIEDLEENVAVMKIVNYLEEAKELFKNQDAF